MQSQTTKEHGPLEEGEILIPLTFIVPQLYKLVQLPSGAQMFMDVSSEEAKDIQRKYLYCQQGMGMRPY